ncbi:MAG TPA: phospholipid carrier-dependent glycosyltransferase [Candidatus Omnitrophota bacterium]|nr:phospholipid carrier-dependent glycosyltransferase [Candidatus Omnitrophota bacterium]
MGKKLPALVFLAFLFFNLLFASGHIGADGFASYLTAESIVLDHDLSILGVRHFDVPELSRGAHYIGSVGRDSRKYSQYGISLPAIEAPFYFIGNMVSSFSGKGLHDYVCMLFVSFADCFVSALLCLAVLLFAFELSGDKRTALAIALLFGLGSFFLPQMRYGYSEPLLALGFLLTVFFLSRLERNGDGRAPLFAGLAFGIALLTKHYVVLFYPLLLIYCVAGSHRNKRNLWTDLLSFHAFVAVSLAAFFLLNYYRFGSILETGYKDISHDFMPAYFLRGFIGQLFSPGKSIFLYFPACFAFLYLVPQMLRKHRNLTLLVLAVIVISILFYSPYVDWNGDVGWGVRYQIILLPLIAVMLGGVLSNLKFIYFLTAVGFAVNLPALIINMADWNYLVFNVIRNGDLFYYDPRFSPVVGGWIQLASLVKRCLTGNSLSVSYLGKLYPVAGFDRIDIWYFTILIKDGVPFTLKIAAAGAALALLLALSVCICLIKKETRARTA